MPRIVSYTWASGEAFGNPTDFQATSTLGVIEQATPLTTTRARPTVPTPMWAPEQATDQLREWGSVLSAQAPAGDYAVTYDPVTRRITVASTTSTNFRPSLPENSARWTGLTQTLSGWATSWTGASEPGGILELLGVTVEPIESWDLVDLAQYRHGRARATAWGNHDVARVTAYVASARLTAGSHQFGFAGRVRVYQDDTITSDFGPLNPGGVVDGFIVGVSDLQESGDAGEIVSVELIVALPRSS